MTIKVRRGIKDEKESVWRKSTAICNTPLRFSLRTTILRLK